MAGRHHLIVLFDGVCNLCNRAVRFIVRRDPRKRFKFAAMQSETGRRLLRKHHLPEESSETMFLIQGDRLYEKSTAALRIVRELEGIWPILYWFILIPGPVRDFIYSIVSRNRYKIFGRREACPTPTKEIRDRFLQ